MAERISSIIRHLAPGSALNTMCVPLVRSL